MGGRFAAYRGQADDAVVVGVFGQCFASGNPGAGFVASSIPFFFHLWRGVGVVSRRPAVAG